MVDRHDHRAARYVAFGFLVMSAIGHACLMPFITLHLKHLGLTATQVGLMRSLQSTVAVFSVPLWIQCAFRYRKRQLIIAVSLCLSIIAYLVVSAVPPLATSTYTPKCNNTSDSVAPIVVSVNRFQSITDKPQSLPTEISAERVVSELPKSKELNAPLESLTEFKPNVSFRYGKQFHNPVSGSASQWKPQNQRVPQPKYASSLNYEDVQYGNNLKPTIRKAEYRKEQPPKEFNYHMPSAGGHMYEYQESLPIRIKNGAGNDYADYQGKSVGLPNHLHQQLNVPDTRNKVKLNEYGTLLKVVPRHLAMYETSAEVRQEPPQNSYSILKRRNVGEDSDHKPYSLETSHYGNYDYTDYNYQVPNDGEEPDLDRSFEMTGVSQELWERLRLPRSNTRHHILKRVLKLRPLATHRKNPASLVEHQNKKPPLTTLVPVNSTTKSVGRRILQFYGDFEREQNVPDEGQLFEDNEEVQESVTANEHKLQMAGDLRNIINDKPLPISIQTSTSPSTISSRLSANSTPPLQSSSDSNHYMFALVTLSLILADFFRCSATVVSDDAWHEYLDDLDELQFYGKGQTPAHLLSAVAVFCTSMTVAATSCLMFNIDHFKIYFYAYAVIVGNAMILALCFPVVSSKFSLSCDPPKALQRLKILFATPTATLFALTVALGGVWTSCSHDYLLWAIEDLGGHEYHFAFAVTIGILSEMVSPSLAKRFIRRFKISKSLAIVVCMSSARLMATALLQSPVGLIFGQSLQFVSVSTVHIILRAYTWHIADPSLNHVVQSSLSMIVHRFGQACGSIIFGPLYDYFGIAGMFFTASITALVWGLFLFAVHKRVTVDNNELCFRWQSPYVCKMEPVPSLLESDEEDWLQDALKKDTFKLKTQAY